MDKLKGAIAEAETVNELHAEVSPKTTPKSRYYHRIDGYNMLHAYKVTPGKRTLHLNVTHDHINALNHSEFRFEHMDEITEAGFNEYKHDVLKRLDVI